MKKSSNISTLRVNGKNSKTAPPATSLDLKDIDLASVVKMGLQDFMFQVGIMAVQQAMGAEVETLAGPRYVRDQENDVYRWGKQQGLVHVNGQKVNTDRPRVMRRTAAGKCEEVELATYREFSKPTAMSEAVMAKMLAGVSTRDYAGTIDQVLDGHGISRSAVSRKAIKTASKRLEEFYTRCFDDHEFVAILIDGIGVADTGNIVALGIDVFGQKILLGIRQGATENTQVCVELLEDLIERGLSPNGDYLFVLDGGKALSKAVKKLFANNAVIQRCQVHKLRNIADKLPKEHQMRINKRLTAAYGMNTFSDAHKAVEAERRFHRVQGYRDLKDLQTKIKELRDTTCNTKAA